MSRQGALEADRLRRSNRAYAENLLSAGAALQMIREALEDICPPGSVKAEEYVLPGFTEEAAALVDAIQKLGELLPRASSGRENHDH